jgi:uncharacterized cysteine cluster protein YcgN (CxxCxxCC family)
MTNKNATLRPRFWETVDMIDMTKPEWEALCDGCGKCCLLKLEDEDTGEIKFTSLSCRLFDDSTCTCQNYALRKQMVAGCVVLTPENIERIAYWMPKSCGYRRTFDGEPLLDWHPLISGDPNSPHTTNNSMMDKTTPEYEVDETDMEDYVIEDL